MRTHIVEDNEGLSPATINIADGVEDAVANESREKLLNKQSQEDGADSGEVEVVDEEDGFELEGLTVPHQLPTAEDDGIVDDDEGARRLEGRHGRLERDKLELIDWIANDGRPGLVEDGP